MGELSALYKKKQIKNPIFLIVLYCKSVFN
jgi:hypothetical protein